MTEDHSIKSHLAILLLAAGASSRMRGGDKLLEEVDGVPLLRKLAGHACAVCDVVLVCLREADEARRSALSELDCQTVVVPDAAEGMAHSLRAGIRKLPKRSSGVMVVLADMPELTQEDMSVLVQAHLLRPHLIIRASTKEKNAGHPVIFPQFLFCELKQLAGDIGASSVLKKNASRVRFVELPERHALTDLDTPDEWIKWRSKQKARVSSVPKQTLRTKH